MNYFMRTIFSVLENPPDGGPTRMLVVRTRRRTRAGAFL